MLKVPLLALIFQGYPESLALTCLAYSLAKLQWKVKKILLIALIHLLVVFVVRSMPITFGSHIIWHLIIYAINLTLLTKIDFLNSLKISITIFTFLFITETVIFKIIVFFTNLSFEFIFFNPFFRIICGLPQVAIVFLVAFIIRKRNNNVLSKFKKRAIL
ncbi:MAG TPA: hypothetical protein GXX38_09545 [Clostridia bacterium]|nr:hypothetical protein [Clostridia bacterium]